MPVNFIQRVGVYETNLVAPLSYPTALERTTPLTGATDSVNLLCVFTMYWPTAYTGPGTVSGRAIFEYGSSTVESYQIFDLRHGLNLAQTYIKLKTASNYWGGNTSWNWTEDVGFVVNDLLTVGISCNGSTGHMFYAKNGGNPVKVTPADSPDGNAIEFTGDATYINRLAYGDESYGAPSNDTYNNKAMADFTLDQQYIDFTVDANIEKYYKKGKPVRPAADGDYGNGQPLIFFGGGQVATDRDVGTNLGSGGDFSINSQNFIDVTHGS